MKRIQLTKDEIFIILTAIHEWNHSTYSDSDDGKKSGYSKKELRAMKSAEEVLKNILKS